MAHVWARREDARLLTGHGRYVADIAVPGCLDAAFVRSSVAHGRLRGVDCASARRVSGVRGAWSAADLPGLPPVPFTVLAGLSDRDAVAGHEWPSLVVDRARYAGEAVAVVAGDDRYRAEDGVAEVTVRMDPLPPMVSVADALDGQVSLFDGMGNVALERSVGAPIDEAVWERAAVVVEGRYRQQLLLPSPMECRAFLAVPEGDRLTVWCSHQAPHRLRRELAEALDLPAGRIRVVTPDSGGAFGSKSATFPEYVTVAFLALTLGRPVRWIEDRAESLLVATRGRGQDQRVRLAADAEGLLLAYELRIDADVGAYPHIGAGLPMQTVWMATGVYATPLVHATLRSVLTTTMPTYPYRGAGRPEAAFALERSMDVLARRLDMDPAELRRRNFIPPGRFPYETPTGRCYDSGNYAGALDLALETLDGALRRGRGAAAAQRPARLSAADVHGDASRGGEGDHHADAAYGAGRQGGWGVRVHRYPSGHRQRGRRRAGGHEAFESPRVAPGPLGRLLALTVVNIAHPPIRALGTMVGSLAWAHPAAEWGAVAVALDAGIESRGPGGTRVVGAGDYFHGPHRTARLPEEMITAVRLPLLDDVTGVAFAEHRRTHASFAQIAVVVALTVLDGVITEARVGLANAADRPVRAHAAERSLVGASPHGDHLFGRAGRIAAERDADPRARPYADVEYQRQVVAVLVGRALRQAYADHEGARR